MTIPAPSRSAAWADRLRRVMPWGSSTCSKAARWLPDEPGVIVRGRGCRVWDADGREFIDYRSALGPVTLGYAFPTTDDAIRRQLDSGIVFGHPHPLEAEVAETLTRIIPCAERARFLKTGGEAVAACLRIARAVTGRDRIIQIGYHGWLNSLAPGGRLLPGQVSKALPPGVPAGLGMLHHNVEWNDREALETLFAGHGGQIAALVVASAYHNVEAGRAFYPFLRDLTQRHGTLLVYDEIVTGFRVALAGVQEYFGVTPDLAVFAKGIANGMPLSAYVGRAAIMDAPARPVVSSTYGGEALSLAAAQACIETYQRQAVVAHLWRVGRRLREGLNALFRQRGFPIVLEGYDCSPRITFGPGAPTDLPERFFRMAYRQGVSLYTQVYVTFSHQDRDADETLERLDAGLAHL